MVDTRKLIHLVRQHDEIYNFSHVHHRNRVHIAHVWQDIAKELNCTREDVKRKWAILRCNFKREKRKLQTKIDEGNLDAKITWRYFRLLKFIDDGMGNNPTLENVQNDNHITSDPSETLHSDEFLNDSDSCSLDKDSEADIVEEKFKVTDDILAENESARKRNATNNDEINLRNCKRRSLSRDDGYNDPDFMFLRSIFPTMKQLDTIESLEFKAEVLQLLKCKLQEQGNRFNDGRLDQPLTKKFTGLNNLSH